MDPETLREQATSLLERWIDATVERDAVAYADLFLRDPEPTVVWISGEVTTTWADVRDQALRELHRGEVLIPRVDLYDVHVVPLDGDTVHTVFRYEIAARDLWGTEKVLPRVGSATLRRTKDGWKFASVHFSAGRPTTP